MCQELKTETGADNLCFWESKFGVCVAALNSLNRDVVIPTDDTPTCLAEGTGSIQSDSCRLYIDRNDPAVFEKALMVFRGWLLNTNCAEMNSFGGCRLHNGKRCAFISTQNEVSADNQCPEFQQQLLLEKTSFTGGLPIEVRIPRTVEIGDLGNVFHNSVIK